MTPWTWKEISDLAPDRKKDLCDTHGLIGAVAVELSQVLHPNLCGTCYVRRYALNGQCDGCFLFRPYIFDCWARKELWIEWYAKLYNEGNGIDDFF